MTKKTTIVNSIASLGLVMGLASGRAAAQIPHNMEQMSPSQMEQPERTGQLQRIEQPLSHKVVVTLGGLGLLGLELWWFLLSKPKSQRAISHAGMQAMTIRVDGGYEPSQIVVQVGQPVRLNFDRQDPSSCLEEVRFPDFHIAQELPLNQITPIEFTPDKPGRYEFTCGMNMFRGVVEVQSVEQPPATAIAPSQATQPGNTNTARRNAETAV